MQARWTKFRTTFTKGKASPVPLLALAALLVLATLFATHARPANAAQQYSEEQYSQGPPGPVAATGVLERAAPHSPDPEPVYAITDEASGTPYELISGFVELEPFVGQAVTIEGVPVPGDPPPGAPLFLNVTSITPADENPGEDPDGGVVVGTVTEISGSVVLVEEDPASDSGGKGYFTVTEETFISKPQGDVRVNATFEELAVGQRVEAAYAGPVAESYPTQGDAASIAILEEIDCPFPGGCNDPDQPPNEVSATGVIGPLADNPDAEHGITDEATGTFYALTSSAVDLDAYADGGQRVAVTGTEVQSLVAMEYPVLEVSRVEVLGGGSEPPPPGESVTFAFELAVECEPPADATFFGRSAFESFVSTPLSDPDGDGVYAGSMTVPATSAGQGGPREPLSLPVQMVQGTGTQGPDARGPLRPGEPIRVVRDFGTVAAEDATFEGSVSFCDGSEPPPPPPPGGTIPPPADGPAPGADVDGNGTVDASDGEEAARVSDSAADASNKGGARVLPNTGGATLALVAGTGVLLTAAGLLVRRATR